MTTTVRRSTFVVLLMLSTACGDSRPTAPTEASRPPVTLAPQPPARDFPPLSGPSRTFNFERKLSYPVNSYTETSQFVLHDNGAFVLQYVSLGKTYRGQYTETNGGIIFEWEGWSTAGPWGATGTLDGDLLTVRFNTIMQLTDFDDSVYALVR